MLKEYIFFLSKTKTYKIVIFFLKFIFDLDHTMLEFFPQKSTKRPISIRQTRPVHLKKNKLFFVYEGCMNEISNVMKKNYLRNLDKGARLPVIKEIANYMNAL